MKDRQPKELGERMATIETDLRWIKWLALGAFASSSIGTLTQAGVAPAPAFAGGAAATALTVALRLL